MTILLPLDGSKDALAAVPIARTLARIEGAPIHVLHVAAQGLSAEDLVKSLRLDAESLRTMVVDQRAGDPAEEIVRLSNERPSIVVLGVHPGSATEALRPSPISERVLLGATGPIVFVSPARGDREWALGSILVPHDGTPTTSAAIRPVALLAHKAGARLFVLHVAAPGAKAPSEPGSIPVPQYVDQRQYEWPAWASEFVERLVCVCPFDVSRLRLSLAPGEPASEIIRFAAENAIDLIVLAWRGMLEPERARILKSVLGAAPCPVMIVRA